MGGTCVSLCFAFYPTEQDPDQGQDITPLIQVEISNHLH